MVRTHHGSVYQTAIAELHVDGSVGIALARGGAFGPTEPAEPIVISRRVVCELVVGESVTALGL
jgi:hypothetical protein